MPPKHAHKYKRGRLGRKENNYIVLKCLTCPHYCTILQSIGNSAECWRCDNPFTMTEKSSKLLKPHCDDCTDRKEKTIEGKVIKEESIDSLLGDLGIKL